MYIFALSHHGSFIYVTTDRKQQEDWIECLTAVEPDDLSTDVQIVINFNKKHT